MFLRKRGFFKHKKGFLEEPLWWFIDVVLVVVFLYFISRYIDNISEATTFEKNFAARDLALMAETMHTSPGNVLIDYPNSTFWFSFNFKNNVVKVFEGKTIPKVTKAFYPYIEDEEIKLKKTIIPEEKAKEKESVLNQIPYIKNFYSEVPKLKEGMFVDIIFAKSGDIIEVGKEKELDVDLRKLKCSAIGTKASFPGNIASVLSQEDVKTALEKVKPGLHEAVVLIRYGNNPDTTANNIKAYVPVNQNKFAESKYLACQILNMLLDNRDLNNAIKDYNLMDITGLSVVPVDIPIGYPEKYIIVLEIGNKAIEEEKSFLSKGGILNKAIGASIERALSG